MGNDNVKGPMQLAAERVANALAELDAAQTEYRNLRDARGEVYDRELEIDLDDRELAWRSMAILEERERDADDKDWLRFGAEKSGVRQLGALEFVAEPPSNDADNVPGCLSVYVNGRAPLRTLVRRVRDLDDPAAFAERLARHITQGGDSTWPAGEVRDGNG